MMCLVRYNERGCGEGMGCEGGACGIEFEMKEKTQDVSCEAEGCGVD